MGYAAVEFHSDNFEYGLQDNAFFVVCVNM